MDNKLFEILSEHEKKFSAEIQDESNFLINLLEDKGLIFKIKKEEKKNIISKIRSKFRNGIIFFVIRLSGLFDDKWYLKKYQDVGGMNLNPLIHFIIAGVYENKNPNMYFDCSKYLKMNPSCLEKNINPLYHYIIHNFYKSGFKTENNYIKNFNHPYLNSLKKAVKDIIRK